MPKRRNLPSPSRLGVLDAPSRSSSAGLVGGGVCTRDPLAFREEEIGAEMEGRRELASVSGRPSSESRSPVVAEKRERKKRSQLEFQRETVDILDGIPCE